MKNKFYTLFFVLLVLGLTLYLPVRLHHSLSSQTQKSNSSIITSTFFYNDAFYYLTIAENYSEKNITTYDGVLPANGYNFLWQYVLNTGFSNIENSQLRLKFVFLLCLLFTLAANIILFLTALKLTKSRVLSLFILFPGFFYLLFSLGLGIYYSPWSIINGLESSLNLFVFSVLLYSFVFFEPLFYRKNTFIFFISFLLTLLFLIRFDEIFLLPAFVIYLLVFEKKQRINLLVKTLSLPLLALTVYLFYNYSNFGLLLPVSGLMKSSFYPGNLIHLFNAAVSGRSFDYLAGVNLFSRVLPLVLPLVLVPIITKVLITEMKQQVQTNFRILLITLSWYVILKSSYILLFVDFWHQGQWYFFNQVALLNLLTAVLISIKIPNLIKSKLFMSGLTLIIIVFLSTYYLNYENNILRSNKLNKSDCNQIDYLINQYLPDGKIVEFDDGIISYSTDNQCLSGFGLCIDKNGFDAIENGLLLDTAYARGYRYIASVNYFKAAGLIPNKINNIEDFAAVPFYALERENLQKWEFAPVVRDTESHLVVVFFQKKIE